MTPPPDFQTMPRQQLRAYVLSHREDEDALRTYMDRLRTEPGIIRYQGGPTDDDLAQLEQYLQRNATRPKDAS
ncbi:DUF6887 family protein [Trichothermofontia sp.]